MSCRTRTLLPTATSLLIPKVIEGVEEKIKGKKQKAKYYYERTAKGFPEMQVGQEVKVTPLERNQPWKRGMWKRGRSLLIVPGLDTETLRRNSKSEAGTSTQTRITTQKFSANTSISVS